MRTQTFISSMVGIAAAVAVAGSANAAIVCSGVQNGSVSLTGGVSCLVMTSNGSFQSDPEYSVTDNPLFVAYGNFSTGNYNIGSTSYSQIGLSGASDDGSNGSFRFQVYGNLATASSSGLKTVVNNTFGTSINGLSGTLAYNGSSAGSGFALSNNNGSYNSYRLNGGSTGAQGGQFNNSTGYVGFRFTTDAGTSWFYGWAKYSGGANGASGTLVEWAYDDTAGGAITAGEVPVPAPGALALLGAAGLVGARRRRA